MERGERRNKCIPKSRIGGTGAWKDRERETIGCATEMVP